MVIGVTCLLALYCYSNWKDKSIKEKIKNSLVGFKLKFKRWIRKAWPLNQIVLLILVCWTSEIWMSMYRVCLHCVSYFFPLFHSLFPNACIDMLKSYHSWQYRWSLLIIYSHEKYITSRGKGDYQIDYVPAPRVTEADKNNDRRYAPIWVFAGDFEFIFKMLIVWTNFMMWCKKTLIYSSIFCRFLTHICWQDA